MQEEYLHLSLQLPAESPGGSPLDVNHLLADSLAVWANCALERSSRPCALTRPVP